MHYASERTASLKEVLQKKHHKFSMEDYHKLRVDIKKITAITRLLDFAVSSFRRKHFLKRYKPVFKAAGSIREWQLEEKLMKEKQLAESLKGYLHKSHQQLKKEKLAFYIPAAKLKRHLKKSAEELQLAAQQINRQTFSDYLQHLQQAIEALLQVDNASYDEVHELRKRLKELYYTIRVFQLPVLNAEAIDRLQDLLGHWHDKLVMSGDIAKKETRKKIKHREGRVLVKLAEDLRAEAVLLFEELKKIIERFKKDKGYLVQLQAG